VLMIKKILILRLNIPHLGAWGSQAKDIIKSYLLHIYKNHDIKKRDLPYGSLFF